MTLQAILFDIDGTLVDSNDFHVIAWQQAFRDHGFEFDRKTIHDQVGKGADMFVPSLLPDVDEYLQQRIGDAHGDIFQSRYLKQVQAFPGARELLARADAAGIKVVLASSASAPEVDHYLDLLGARSLVTATTGGDDVERTKPAPDIFAAALKKVAPIRPDEAIVIGDTPYDVEAAGKCGIPAVAVRSGGFDDTVLQRAGALCLYDDVAALLADFDRSPLSP